MLLFSFHYKKKRKWQPYLPASEVISFVVSFTEQESNLKLYTAYQFSKHQTYVNKDIKCQLIRKKIYIYEHRHIASADRLAWVASMFVFTEIGCNRVLKCYVTLAWQRIFSSKQTPQLNSQTYTNLMKFV